MKSRVLFLFAVAALAACSKTPSTESSADSTKPSMAMSAAQPVIVTGEERKKIVTSLTKGMDEERDKMEAISFYSAKGAAYLGSKLEAYISLPDNRLPLLRIKSTYFGDDWVFYDTIKVMADDVVTYERTFDHGDVHHDNSGGSVWETADFRAQVDDLAALKRIANAKTATIRFSGREHREDHELTKKEFQQLKAVIDVYEKLTSKLQHA